MSAERSVDASILGTPYTPSLDPERVAFIREWHEDAYAAAIEEGEGGQHFLYHGLELDVPADVMPLTGSSHLLGDAVAERASPGQRVLDMGTGCGVNALLAARAGAAVVAVDVNPSAVAATRANAAANGLANRVDARESDVFSDVDGLFDLVVVDPPYRWFEPRDALEAAMSDAGYRMTRTFFAGVVRHLAPGGSVLVGFASTGDVVYLRSLGRAAGLSEEILAQKTLVAGDHPISYFVFRFS
ncbi:MAG TPA: methyltransferase [Acidimicrobiales bacterium]|nr:methyltransferase [Acidimicrobiales bacterium]